MSFSLLLSQERIDIEPGSRSTPISFYERGAKCFQSGLMVLKERESFLNDLADRCVVARTDIAVHSTR